MANRCKENRVVRILMDRDDMTKEEATEEVSRVQEMMLEAVDSGQFSKVEEILMDELGLEPDYIFDII